MSQMPLKLQQEMKEQDLTVYDQSSFRAELAAE